MQMFVTYQLCFNTKSKKEKFKEMTNLTSCFAALLPTAELSGAVPSLTADVGLRHDPIC